MGFGFEAPGAGAIGGTALDPSSPGGKSILHSELASVGISDHHLRPFDAVVSPTDPAADFTSIAAAFTSGAKSVFAREGVYVETDDILIPPDGLLEGEAPGAVTIVMAAGKQIKIDGSGRKTTTGTISCSNGSATVTGVGTTFTSLLPDDWIALNGVFHQIDSIATDTSLTLKHIFRGRTFATVPMLGQSMLTGAGVKKLIVANATISGLLVRQALNFILSECLFEACGVAGDGALRVEDATSGVITAVVAQNSTDHGIRVINSRGIRLETCGVRNSVGRGISIEGSRIVLVDAGIVAHCGTVGYRVNATSTEITITDSQAIQNASHGFETIAGSSITTLGSCLACANGGDGARLGGDSPVINGGIYKSNVGAGITALSSRVNVSGSYVAFNGAHGINAEASPGGVTITGNTIRQNTGDGVRAGLRTSINGNCIDDNTVNGINSTGKDECSVAGNRVLGNGADGINVSGDFWAITGNVSRTNAQSGIELTVASSACAVVGNQLTGNTGMNLINAGVGNTVMNNVIV